MVSIGRSAYGEPALLFELIDPRIASEMWSHWAAVVAVSLMPLACRHGDLVPAWLMHGEKQKQTSISIPGYSLLAKVPSSWALMCRQVSFQLLHPEWQHWLRFTHLAIHRWLSIVTGGDHLMSVWLSSGCRDSVTPQRSPDRPPRSRQLSPLQTQMDCKVRLITSELPWGRRKRPGWCEDEFNFP